MPDPLAYEYNGLEFGDGSDYNITKVDGLEPPDNREDIIEKAARHGSWIFSQYVLHRRVTFEGFCIENDPEDLAALYNGLRAAFGPLAADLPLKLHMPGEVEQRLYGVPVKRYWDHDLDFTLGYFDWRIQILCGDPRFYAEDESSLSIDGNAENAGLIGTAPVVTVTGASTDFEVENTTTGEVLRLDGSTVLGDVLVLDFDARTIMLNGISTYSLLDLTTDWFDLAPGDNAIDFSGLTGAGAAEMTWRSAWL